VASIETRLERRGYQLVPLSELNTVEVDTRLLSCRLTRAVNNKRTPRRKPWPARYLCGNLSGLRKARNPVVGADERPVICLQLALLLARPCPIAPLRRALVPAGPLFDPLRRVQLLRGRPARQGWSFHAWFAADLKALLLFRGSTRSGASP